MTRIIPQGFGGNDWRERPARAPPPTRGERVGVRRAIGKRLRSTPIWGVIGSQVAFDPACRLGPIGLAVA